MGRAVRYRSTWFLRVACLVILLEALWLLEVRGLPFAASLIVITLFFFLDDLLGLFFVDLVKVVAKPFDVVFTRPIAAWLDRLPERENTLLFQALFIDERENESTALDDDSEDPPDRSGNPAMY